VTYDLAWTSDLRFDRMDAAARTAFIERLEERCPNALLVAGDLATGPTLARALQWLGELGVRTYFVLGNRDGWGMGFGKARGIAHDTCRQFPLLTYLSTTGVVQLAPDLALVGADGWYDARAGKCDTTPAPPDFARNPDLAARPTRAERIQWVRMWADYAERQIMEGLTSALQHHSHVIVATHVSPWPHGTHNLRSLPWAVHQELGVKLREVARAFPERTISVFCGHSRATASLQVSPNLTCHTSAARHLRTRNGPKWGVGSMPANRPE